ncbi:hypothetical protein [Dictyobacter formicarum]|uniref:Uncharacterized protein n=1 Tax=Dictyobacter formicarum TaxID=2778368 RepID=A0ABQ3VQ39_9CHLR|nr:hypothetical protein [Dictyobacter formicarum]GHO88379.1 hypothetical protein KSZ_63850 [Dictyobacter formicarum]
MAMYEICVKGHLDQNWSEWFDGMTFTYKEDRDTVITGPVIDQAALHSLLVKIYDLNLTLLSVTCIKPDPVFDRKEEKLR